jgi:hypothetical protein
MPTAPGGSGDGPGRDKERQRWPAPADLVCPVCRRAARPEPPAYWRVADGPRPDWSHHDREPLCQVIDDAGVRPALPVSRRTARRGDVRRLERPPSSNARRHGPAGEPGRSPG